MSGPQSRPYDRPEDVYTIVVVATGTDVGKTHVTCALLAQLASAGVRAAAYKPIASGVDPVCEDVERHAAIAGSPPISASFAYVRPVSPHLAAREEGRPIDLAVVQRRSVEIARDTSAEVLVVESAGGLFSPLATDLTNVDLVRALAPAAVLLVAPDRLGVLHDVRATLLAAAASGVAIHSVVLSAPAVADSSTGTNARELEAVGAARVDALFPREAPDSGPSQAAAAAALAALFAAMSPQRPLSHLAR